MKIYIRSDKYDDVWDYISEINQEFTSENTSQNSKKLPSVFGMKGVSFQPGTINLDYGGGRFDNVAEYLIKIDVINLVLDPFNRTREHNKQVIDTLRDAGGADTATCANVLNVIKERDNRMWVLRNMQKLVKHGGTIYIIVYEDDGTGNEGETTRGYQLRRKTKEYMDEILEVFPNAKRNGKLITIVN